MSRPPIPSAAPPPFASGLDRFSVFGGTVHLTGWCVSRTSAVVALELRPAGFPQRHAGRRFTPPFLPSPDLLAGFGPGAAQCRFDAAIAVGPHAAECCGGTLVALLEDGTEQAFRPLGRYRPNAATALFHDFFDRLKSAPPGQRILELGARTTTGQTLRGGLPESARYTGVDIKHGDNVDVVADAHALSDSFAPDSFDAVFAVSVLEHLLMPWKAVLELNRILAPGALGLFTTHQCWPMHEQPWDYWRFSDRAWTGLLNAATGFEILGAAMGEPAYIVARDCHPATNFVSAPAGFLASNVLFRKSGPTTLGWNVALADLTDTSYPG